MGIQILSTPKNASPITAGPFTLPEDFDQKKFAAKWVKCGQQAAAAENREYIPGTTLTADGWKVWQGMAKKPHKIPLATGEHVLLCRPRDVQDDVNAICGNVGKERLLQEKRGETTGGVPLNDPGMLSDDKIAKVEGRNALDGDGDVVFNVVKTVDRRVTTPVFDATEN
jgi:hypothetical protein